MGKPGYADEVHGAAELDMTKRLNNNNPRVIFLQQSLAVRWPDRIRLTDDITVQACQEVAMEQGTLGVFAGREGKDRLCVLEPGK